VFGIKASFFCMWRRPRGASGFASSGALERPPDTHL
jgi:hypothetical protein